MGGWEACITVWENTVDMEEEKLYTVYRNRL